ncbi:MAG TPA: hypothetical protein PL033_04660 [Candidatus Brocadiia bacterium]|nr:hypothetical protein [Candidatus Brocadiia bacterium]
MKRKVETPDQIVYVGRIPKFTGMGIFIFAVSFIVGMMMLGVGFLEAARYVIPPPLAIGALLLMVRRRLTFNLVEGTCDERLSLLMEFRPRIVKLSDFDRVMLDIRSHESSNKLRQLTFGVRLVSKSLITMDIMQVSKLETALAEAEFLAKRLKLDLEDRTMGAPVVRPVSLIGLSLREQRIASPQAPADMPPPPPSLHSKIGRQNGSLSLEIPPTGLRPFHPLNLPMTFSFGLGLVFSIIPFGGPPSPIAAIPVFYGLGGLIYRMLCQRSRLVIGRDELKHWAWIPLSWKLTAIPASQITVVMVGVDPAKRMGGESYAVRKAVRSRYLKILVPSRSEIIVRYGAKSLTFGGHLPPEEKEWLAEIIRRMVG